VGFVTAAVERITATFVLVFAGLALAVWLAVGDTVLVVVVILSARGVVVCCSVTFYGIVLLLFVIFAFGQEVMSLEAASSLAAFAGRLQLVSDRFSVSTLDSAQYNHVGSLGAISAVGCATLDHRAWSLSLLLDWYGQISYLSPRLSIRSSSDWFSSSLEGLCSSCVASEN